MKGLIGLMKDKELGNQETNKKLDKIISLLESIERNTGSYV